MKNNCLQVFVVKDLIFDSETFYATSDGFLKRFTRKKTPNSRYFFFILRPPTISVHLLTFFTKKSKFTYFSDGTVHAMTLKTWKLYMGPSDLFPISENCRKSKFKPTKYGKNHFFEK